MKIDFDGGDLELISQRVAEHLRVLLRTKMHDDILFTRTELIRYLKVNAALIKQKMANDGLPVYQARRVFAIPKE